jgi:antitoxin (DNA-binding transcriptional repressor) of toxin-antitoxin stability system
MCMAQPKTVNIHEAKTHFSKLLRRVARGEEVVISRAGQPIARLSRINPPLKERVPGSAKGLFVVPDNFNDPLPPEIQRYFEGEED